MSAQRGVWERLAEVAPVSPELTAMLTSLEHLGLRDLEERLEECHDELRAWAARPENRLRRSAESPRRIERLALGTLLERRLWWE